MSRKRDSPSAVSGLVPRLLLAAWLVPLLAHCGGHPAPRPDPAGVAAPAAAPAPAPPEAVSPAPEPPEEPPPGIFHRVERGQTLYTIARTYGVPLSQVLAANDIPDPDRIEIGTLVFIPGAETTLDVPATVSPTPAPALHLRSPADGPVNSPFGPRHGRMHYGLDIGAGEGSPVRAAADGTVIYSGSGYRGYGRLVILDHGGGVRTLYAHNRRLLVQTGQHVRAGEIIARVGASGNATGPHLHFEVRLGDRPVDPAPYLARR